MKKLIYIPVAAGVLAFGGIVLANSETPAANPAAKTGTVTNEVQKSSTPEEMLSFEEISAKALELASGRITDIELDKDDRRAHYEVDVDFEGYEYDFEFDAYTGEVLEHKREKDRNDDVKQSSTAVSPASTKTADSKSGNQAVSNKDLIGSDKAIEAALAVVSGTVEGFELEMDDGFAYYEIEIKDGRSEHDVDVNAKDGSILKVDSDFDDDDSDDDWD
ncbi:PepSY domain-containing protein [Microbacterium sp. APC 3898]|uniref:PepSY domain-containing protein n=2 Tax=Planococcus TaxID=1372 RepID=A0ABT7ZFN6_9BACL|nr:MULTISPECIES: PepSY domain-containing protein [Terrabacteria group]MBD8013672.1 PepSY domain-containing protein [Planococcus wigleyi]MDN3425975.1 PepSY domain-containing protein [Planococcus sp. APC 4016]MDN3497672.1 PepSY domain-containing protein [Microbacterium sp. APC 3898]